MSKIIGVIFLISFALGACSLADDVKPSASYAVNHGKNDKTYYHLLFKITPNNLAKIESLTTLQFKQNGGQFEVFLKKDLFPIAAENCKSDIILRMPWVANQVELTQKYQLYKSIQAIFDRKEGFVTVAIELNPYVQVNENGPQLTQCNVFFRHANNQYIPHTHSIN